MKSTLPKTEIAEIQLKRAISLYCEGSDLVCAITLAGAAEEILGDLLLHQGCSTALEETAQNSESMFRYAYPDDPLPPRKVWFALGNDPRNELKHLRDGKPLTCDWEDEAQSMINRAIKNFRRLGLVSLPDFYEFERVWLARERAKEAAVLRAMDPPPGE